jgi:hypothetical protein
MFGLPMEAKMVQKDVLQSNFPPEDILDKWYRGEDAPWPPEPEPMELRFDVGTHVLCRVGPTEWAPGIIQQIWYRERAWPEGMYAPYKIHLDDGRDIFAPQDMDQVIRLNPDFPPPTTTTTATSTTGTSMTSAQTTTPSSSSSTTT